MLVLNALAKPAPQEDEDKANEEKDDDKKKDDLGEVLGGLFDIFNQAVKAAGDIASDEVNEAWLVRNGQNSELKQVNDCD